MRFVDFVARVCLVCLFRLAGSIKSSTGSKRCNRPVPVRCRTRDC